MKNHTELLNYLATTFNLQSYLEIGVQNPVNNFDKIVCKRKAGVEPSMKSHDLKLNRDLFAITSDEFFSINISKYDLIFIDGLHHANQVKRDFENSLQCLNDNGFIVIHDTLPEKEEYTHVPRDSKIWNGDVWKFAVSLIKYGNIDFCTLDIDHGCTIVWKDDNNTAKPGKVASTWNEFQNSKEKLLNIVSEIDFYTEMSYLK